jgi:hypothetical protein
VAVCDRKTQLAMQSAKRKIVFRKQAWFFTFFLGRLQSKYIFYQKVNAIFNLFNNKHECNINVILRWDEPNGNDCNIYFKKEAGHFCPTSNYNQTP